MPSGEALDRARAGSRRPLGAEEIPSAEALGKLVAGYRTRARYSQAKLGLAAALSAGHVYRIEHAIRRTRRSTLERIADVLWQHLPGVTREALVQHLVETAGIALAPETDYPERVNGRREKRAAKNAEREKQRVFYAGVLRELRPSPEPGLRGPDGRFLPRQPTPEKVKELEQHYKHLGMVMPPRDGDGRFIEDSPMLDNRTARAYFNPPKRYPEMERKIGSR